MNAQALSFKRVPCPRSARSMSCGTKWKREPSDVGQITQTEACTTKGNPRSLYDLVTPAAKLVHSDELIKRALAAIRTHLGMDVAYVSQFEGDRSIFRVVDAPGLEHLIKSGDSRPLDEVYCSHILEGRLPQL